jgi:hypothetical protein
VINFTRLFKLIQVYERSILIEVTAAFDDLSSAHCLTEKYKIRMFAIVSSEIILNSVRQMMTVRSYRPTGKR